MLVLDGARAPSLLWYELLNILVMATRQERLADGEAVAAITRLLRLPIETVDMTLSDDAKMIVMSVDHRLTAYDATCLLLAQSTNVPLMTADKTLAHAARRAGVQLLLGTEKG